MTSDRLAGGRRYTDRVSRTPSRKSSSRREHAGASSLAPTAEPRWLSVIAAHPHLVLALATAIMVLPFIGRPFNIDDPMYIWAAEQIRAHPLDFYGFRVFWTGADLPMHVLMQNPPLASYYIALASLIAGFNEIVLHLAFLVPAIGLILGTYQLARALCRPAEAALAALLTIVMPVFIICANTITCDILMACFWVWAVFLWDRGLRRAHWPSLLCSSLLIAAACLTKYPGVNLIPLLAAYTLVRRARWSALLWLLAPVGVLAGYELLTKALYEEGLLSSAAEYARTIRARREAEPLFKSFITLCFMGGCLAPTLFLAPVIWRWRGLAIGATIALAVLVTLITVEPERIRQIRVDEQFNWALVIQMALWAPVGAGVIAITLADLWKRRDAESLLLALWVIGTFVFAGLVNWSVNGRSLLPMAPAVAIIVARRLDVPAIISHSRARRFVPAALAASALMCLALGWADTRLAWSARKAARLIAAQYAHGSATLWFQGHWGFQYYLQHLGAQPFIVRDQPIRIGDVVAIPLYNTNADVNKLIQDGIAVHVDVIAIESFPWASTMNVAMGAGFYADASGPLPFVFGSAPDEQYRIVRIIVPYEPPARLLNEAQ
jgi:4-amino-4-deoxy-L-arabinose transferase-like glycosyltransferase